jgi:hypothetical protein
LYVGYVLKNTVPNPGGLKTYGSGTVDLIVVKENIVACLVVKPALAHAHLRATDWRVNAMGRNYSHSFGYGIMDASAMVRMARIWNTVPEQKISAVKADIGKIIQWSKKTSVADPGMFVPDPGSEFIRVVHPGSGSWFLPIPDPGSRGRKGTGSWIRIRNTEKDSLKTCKFNKLLWFMRWCFHEFAIAFMLKKVIFFFFRLSFLLFSISTTSRKHLYSGCKGV